MGGFDLAWLFLERWRLPGSQVLLFWRFWFVCFVGILKFIFNFNRINFFLKMLLWHQSQNFGEVDLDEVFNGNTDTT